MKLEIPQDSVGWYETKTRHQFYLPGPPVYTFKAIAPIEMVLRNKPPSVPGLIFPKPLPHEG